MEASSAVNAPHPDGPPPDADAFFEEGTAPDPGTFNPESGEFDKPAQTAPPGPSDAQAEAAAYREQHGEPVQAAGERQGDPEPEPTPEPQAAAPAAAAVGDGDGKASGSLEREYIVFQHLPLTERVLKHLLEELGKGNQPRTALFELHRAVTRNDKAAVAEAYAQNKGSLGDKCDLAAVSARSFKTRHVEPKEVVESSLSIT